MNTKPTSTEAPVSAAASQGTDPSGTNQFCTFYVDRMFLGINVCRVQEVMREQKLTPVPTAPEVVSGLMNLRGQIVTAIDLRSRLGIPPRAPGTPTTNIVVRESDGIISFIADEIGDVVSVGQTIFEPPPETVPPSMKTLLTGVYKLDGKLLLIVNIERLVDIEIAEAA